MKLSRPNTPTKPRRVLSPALARVVATWRLFWQQRSKLMLITAVVAVPSTFIRSASAVTVDFSSVLFIAAMFAVLALIYYCHHLSTAPTQSIAKTYTQASGRFLQLLGVTLLQALVLLPGVFAVVLMVFVGGFGLSTLLYIPGVILLALTALGMSGLSLAQYIAACEGVSIVGALRGSWQRTKGLKLKLVGHFALILLIISVVSTGVFFVVNISSLLATSWFVQGLVSSVLIVIALPWFITYGYSIYDEAK